MDQQSEAPARPAQPMAPGQGQLRMIPAAALQQFLHQDPPSCVMGHDFERLEPNKEGYFKDRPGFPGTKDQTKRWTKLFCNRCGIGLEIILQDYAPIPQAQQQMAAPAPPPTPTRTVPQQMEKIRNSDEPKPQG